MEGRRETNLFRISRRKPQPHRLDHITLCRKRSWVIWRKSCHEDSLRYAMLCFSCLYLWVAKELGSLKKAVFFLNFLNIFKQHWDEKMTCAIWILLCIFTSLKNQYLCFYYNFKNYTLDIECQGILCKRGGCKAVEGARGNEWIEAEDRAVQLAFNHNADHSARGWTDLLGAIGRPSQFVPTNQCCRRSTTSSCLRHYCHRFELFMAIINVMCFSVLVIFNLLNGALTATDFYRPIPIRTLIWTKCNHSWNQKSIFSAQ